MAEAAESDGRTVVRFENVGLRYDMGPEVLRDVSFALAPGSFHFLIGESGAGKSSLLKLAYLALRPSRGRISLFESDAATVPRDLMPRVRREIGVVFQEFKLLDHLPAYDNVALPLRVAGVRESDVKTDVAELLDWVGLKDHMKARPPTLSGGQKQRVAIARAIVHRPSLLIADEPTGNVDDRMAVRLMHLFEELNRMGTTVVVATHNQALVERLGHPTLRLEAGRLTASGGAGAPARRGASDRIRVGRSPPPLTAAGGPSSGASSGASGASGPPRARGGGA